MPDGIDAPGDLKSPVRVAFYTFGCKLNQCETAGIRARFERPGYSVVAFEEPAEVYIINTCSVTGRADAQARQLVRRLVRSRAGCRVVVTGCYAQRAPRELAAIPGVLLVAGNGEKERLGELVDEALAGTRPVDERSVPAPSRVVTTDLRKARRSFDLLPVDFGERTRAFLRVQDGCDAACSFCIIPHLRGRSTSLPVEAAVGRVAELVAHGYREIVLTGIHLGMFGRESGGAGTLASLVRRIDSLPGNFRVRLSSIEPQEIDRDLVELMRGSGRLVPHLHVPLQSGCARILKLMNRTYSVNEYKDVMERLTTALAEPGIGADLIVGFPGETEADFAETVRFVEAMPFTYLHVFPYSPRPGTRAASLPGRPPGDVVEARGERLREISDEKRRAFAARMKGRVLEVLVEEPAGETAWEGWSERYVRVAFEWDGPADLTNELLPLEATGVDQPGRRALARPVTAALTSAPQRRE